MAYDTVVRLQEGGHFSADGPAGRFDLLLDDACLDWLLLAPPPREGAGQPVLDRLTGLDRALARLVAAAGLPAGFRVELPCGNRILRPGRVAVEAILAAHGYRASPSATAYAMEGTGRGGSEHRARSALEVRLDGAPARVAEIEAMDEEGAEWCCAVTVPYAGVFRDGDADGIVEAVLGDRDLRLIARSELDPGPAWPAPNAARVVRLDRLIAAA